MKTTKAELIYVLLKHLSKIDMAIMSNKENIRSIETQLNCQNMHECQKERTKFSYFAGRLRVMFMAILHKFA